MLKIDNKPNLAWMDDPVKSDKWRNIYLLKNGCSHIAPKIHPSEEFAYQISRKNIDECNGLFLKTKWGVQEPGFVVGAIQMPVKE